VSALELLRLSRAAMLLARSNLSAEAIAHDCGFANPTPTTSRAGSTASTASHPAATAAPLE
jgi:transcriptional regulator GlxA family with amidase domain